MTDLLVDLALPRTDAGVALQAGIVFPLLLSALVAVRHRPEWRLFVTGLLVVTLAGFGLRTLH